MASSRGEDVRKFLHSHVYCARHNTKLQSLREVGLHRQLHKENKQNVKFLCGCCGKIFRRMEEICSHINTAGFHTKRSTIPNYNIYEFDVQAHISQVETEMMVREAAQDAKRQAAAQRHAIASAAAPLLERLQSQSPHHLTSVASIPPCCLLSTGLATPRSVTTVAGSATAPVSSIYLLQQPVMTTVIDTPVTAPATATRPPSVSAAVEEVVVAALQTLAPQDGDLLAEDTHLVVVDSSPPTGGVSPVQDMPQLTASTVATPVLDSDRHAISDLMTFVDTQPIPTFSTAVTTLPDLTMADNAFVNAPPMASALEWQYPSIIYSSMATMPTSYLVQSLVFHLQWLTSILRAYVARSAPPSALRFIDEGWRPLLMQTPMWPGQDFTLSSDLGALLEALVARYAALGHRASYFR